MTPHVPAAGPPMTATMRASTRVLTWSLNYTRMPVRSCAPLSSLSLVLPVSVWPDIAPLPADVYCGPVRARARASNTE